MLMGILFILILEMYCLNLYLNKNSQKAQGKAVQGDSRGLICIHVTKI